jgi:hypothetical protein
MNMNSEEQPTRRGTWFSPGTVLIVCVGILVPIIAALIPVARTQLRAHDFRYSVSGPVTVAKRIAFAITVRNRGRIMERNVEIWIPKGQSEQEFQYEITWAPPGTRIRDEAGYKVFVIGDLKPEEIARVSVMTGAPAGPASVGDTRGEQFVPSMAPRIVSADGPAQWVPATRRASVMRYVYQIGFWGFIILVVSAILWAVSSSRLGRRLLRRR